ncbi:MAG TPA: DUF262 domain-containing protein [Thermoanaerobaculia bacterium]|nr:DUF262 domain-containing protein [Thermoanaerobaculia bacterium]
MNLTSPRLVEFRSIKQLLNRFSANRKTERGRVISFDELDVPPWQRQIVWTPEDMGLLAYSIINNYPIGMLILWRRPDGIRVPIDGRQRLRAIRAFAEGQIAIPTLKHIPSDLHNAKYKLIAGDEKKGCHLLDLTYREAFEDYEPAIWQYDEIDERTAMDIFVKLQGGKSLTKAEVRGALGGKLCDFVTELTTHSRISEADDDDAGGEEEESRHPFFREVSMANTRKAHRNLCDVLLHESLYPGQDKHWSSLESMYLDRASTFTMKDRDEFRRQLNGFFKDVQMRVGKDKIIIPQLRTTFLILSYFRAWLELRSIYALPVGFDFGGFVRTFEKERRANQNAVPWVIFNAALSNAGYAKNRTIQRHEILMSFVFRSYPGIKVRDRRRLFTVEQRLAIWDRAGARCEWRGQGSSRCDATFPNPRDADADHIVKWSRGGPTSLENGRLLCKKHNRANAKT